VWKPRLFVLLVECASLVSIGTTAMAQSSPPLSGSRADWTLDDVLTAALAQHPLVQAAQAQARAAEGKKLGAATFPNPIATFWMENARFPGQAPLAGVAQETSAYATLPLEPLIQRGARLTQVDADIRAARATVTRTERDVALDASHAFYRVALAQASVEAVRENLTAVDELVTYLRTRVAQGANPEVELIRAEVERDRVDSDVALAEVELIRAQSALRVFLGDAAPPAATIRVTSLTAARGGSPLAPVSAFTTHALQARPDVLASRASVDAASGAVAVERSLLVRQLGATFGMKRTAGTTGMIAGVSATVPLFDRNRGGIQRATDEGLAAEQGLRWLERSITGEIEGAYEVATRLTARVAAVQPTSVSRAEESRRIAVAAFQEGATPLLQVLDASRALTDARLSLARLIGTANESLFELGLAAGYDAKAAAALARGVSTMTPSATPAGGLR